MGVSLIREGSVNPWLFGNHPMDPGPAPEGYRYSLLLLYAITVMAVWILWRLPAVDLFWVWISMMLKAN